MRRAATRTGGGAVLVIASLLAAAGCGPQRTARHGETSVDVGAEPAAARADPSGPPDELAAMIERDIRDLQALRLDGGRPAPGETDPSTVPAATPTASALSRATAARTPATPERTIQWIEPSSSSRVASAPLTVSATPTGLPGAPGDPASADRASAPARTDAPLDLQLVHLRQELFHASIESDQPLRDLIAIAATAIIDPSLQLPDAVSRDLTDEEMELLRHLHTFFRTLGSDLDGTTPAVEVVARAASDLQTSLVEAPQLRLPAYALCWRVGGFGDYDEFERQAFLAQAEQQVILYLEIDGFTSRLNKNEQWVTELSQQFEIYSDRDGIPVWSEPWQKAVDVTANARHDFFTTQLITLPRALSVGRYHLKIRVRDEASGAEAEESVLFEMVADPKMAARVPRGRNGGSEAVRE